MTTVKLSEIRIDGGTQPRTEIDYQLVSEYAESIESLPPITVFFDGATYWLADGFHRYFAHKNKNCETISCKIKTGPLRDAKIYSLGANADHGARRKNIDKRKAIETCLKDPDVCIDPKTGHPWSNSKIAEICKVDEKTVRNFISTLSAGSEIPKVLPNNNTPDEPEQVIGKDGKSYPAKRPKTTLSKPEAPTSYTAPFDEQGPDEDNTIYSEETGALFEEKSEYEKVLEEGQTLKSNSQKSSNMHYASFAISQLERINKKEPDAKTAFDAVVLWIERNR